MLAAWKLTRHGSFNMSTAQKLSVNVIALGVFSVVSFFCDRSQAQFVPRSANAARATRDYVIKPANGESVSQPFAGRQRIRG